MRPLQFSPRVLGVLLIACLAGIAFIAALTFIDHKRVRQISRLVKHMVVTQAAAPASSQPEQAERRRSPPIATLASLPLAPLSETAIRLKRWAMVDGADIYQKAGLVEVYGGSLAQSRTGPVSVTSAILTSEASRVWLAWTPDHVPVIDAEHIVLELDPDTALSGTITVGLTFSTGAAVAWNVSLGAAEKPVTGSAAEKAPEPAVPDDLAAILAKATPVGPMTQAGPGRFFATVPDSVRAILQRGDASPVRLRSWVFSVQGDAPAATRLRSLAFVDNRVPLFEASRAAALAGQVMDIQVEPGQSIRLLGEGVREWTTQLAPDGSFRFSDVPPDQAVSLRFRYKERDYYAAQGRWFRTIAGTMPVFVRVLPEFSNPEGKAPDPKTADVKIEYDQEGEVPTIFRYAKHRRTYWPGGGTAPQEFAGRSFANNFGQLDRDRSLDNPDRCLRIFVVGASDLNALQVKPGEKFNIVLESELGRRLGRCVEVASAGRDNGDIAANYRVIRDYGMKLRPDVVLIDHMAALAAQMEPTLLRRTLGWSYEHNVLDNFFFDEAGKLTFRSWDPSWALDAVPATGEPLIPNLGLFDSFSIPIQDFAAEAKASFDLFAAIARKLAQDFPDSRFVLISALDQSRCHRALNCDGIFTLPDGRTVRKGVVQLMANFSALCTKVGIDCVQARIPEKPQPDELLSYPYDAHYSIRGHQWLAGELAEGLSIMLERKRPEIPGQ